MESSSLNLKGNLTLKDALEFMRTQPWNFYYVKAKKDPEHALYQQRREKIDFIGAMINTLGDINEPRMWDGIGHYQFSQLDEIMESLLKDHPDRWFVPRIKMDPPDDWLRAHPEEVCVYWGGPQDPAAISAMVGTPQHDRYGWDDDRQRHPYPNQLISNQSFSSQVWVRDASEFLKALVKHIEASPYGPQTLGYMFGFGNCGEDMWWGDWRNQGDPRKGDFGISHRRHFYAWAVEKYGSVEALRKAWGQPDLTEDNLRVPTPPQRWSEDGKNLRQVMLADDQKQVDCNEFHSKVCFDALEAFGKVVKDICGKPTGCFYGYLQDETVGYAGHLAIDRAVTTPYVDFYSSPKAYHYCLAGDPGASQAPGQSIARKKLWIEENDMRSHHALSVDSSRANKTPSDTCTAFWRELYRALTFNQGFWWMDINGLRDDWYGDEDMVVMFKKQADLYKKWSPVPRKGIAQVLFVEDEASCGHTTYLSSPQRNLRLRLERELKLCGAPVDHYRLDDLFEIDMSRYRFIVFCHAFVMPKSLWDKVLARIRPDAHILFNYAAGLLAPEFSYENQKAVTGFSVRECPGRMQPSQLYHHLYWHGTHHCPQDYPLLEILPQAGQKVWETSPDGHILTASVSRGKGRNIFAAEFTLREPLLRQFLEEAQVDLLAPEYCTVLADEKLAGFFPKWDVCFDYDFNGCWRNVLTGETVSGRTRLRIRERKFEIFEKAE